MARFAVAFTFLAVAVVGIANADDKALKEIEGTYKITSADKGGKAAPKELIDTATVTIKGDELTISFGADDKKVAKIKLNAEAKPATIDISPSEGDQKGKTFPGIYKADKGELTIAFTEKTDRPKEFKSEDDVVILKLKKAEK